MIRAACGAVLLALVGAGDASALSISCPEPGGNLLFHSCWGESRAELVLLPDEAGKLSATDEARREIVVTGAYTGKDLREAGTPNPVGLFIDNGQIINPNAARMDGIALIDPEFGVLRIERRSAVRLGETGDVVTEPFDLTKPDLRRAFAETAQTRGYSVIQSHLLIDGGELDIRPTEDAPIAVRRLLFTDEQGWGLWQTADAMTLHDAAVELQSDYGPERALNLDMGSYDYCFEIVEGANRNCGLLGVGDTSKLSNLLRFSYKPWQ